MTWEQAMAYARERSRRQGCKIYVRGYQRTISHVGTWLYGNYDTPDPKSWATSSTSTPVDR